MNRPLLHFTPSSGWINDPYGVTWHDGRYHLFFQKVPDQATWSPEQHWGHAVSDDLVAWREQPAVLSPDEGQGGIWSGSVLPTPDGGALLFYTSERTDSPDLGTVRVARRADASWMVWHRSDRPIVAPPPDLGLTTFRDPFVLHDGTCWRMVVGAGRADGTALALTWTSEDLGSWRYGGILASRHDSEVLPVWTGTVWECPQLFRLDDAWVLLVSVWAAQEARYEAYGVGDLVAGRFVARVWHRLTYGPAHYAGSVFTDAAGRCCLVHWLRGVEDPDGVWAGAYSVPHVLRLDGDRVVAEPHPALAAHVEQVGSVQVVVDGPVVEVFTPEGVAGYAIRP